MNLIFLITKECVSIVLNQKIFCLSFIVLLNISCANIVPPSGGDKDVDPPNLQKTQKIIQPQGNVSIVFSFDEFIEINNWDQKLLYLASIKQNRNKRNQEEKFSIKLSGLIFLRQCYV